LLIDHLRQSSSPCSLRHPAFNGLAKVGDCVAQLLSMAPEDRSLPGERSAAGVASPLPWPLLGRGVQAVRTRCSGWELMREVVLKDEDGRLLPLEIAFAVVKAMKQVPVGTTRLSTSTHAHPQPLGESITLGDVRLPASPPSCTERP